MPAAPGGPRLLLRRLREAMAEPVSPQARLDRIVVLIAANVIAEVCSVYVVRDDNTLELFATEGLNRDAVHLTRLRADEGLVGLIAKTAEPLALSDAQSHPAFSYRPETGKRSITPSSACRSCGPATRSASWSSRTRPTGSIPRRRSRRSRPPPWCSRR